MYKYSVIVTRTNNSTDAKPTSEETIAVCNFFEDAKQLANKHTKRIIKEFDNEVKSEDIIQDAKTSWHFIPLQSGETFRVYVR